MKNKSSPHVCFHFENYENKTVLNPKPEPRIHFVFTVILHRYKAEGRPKTRQKSMLLLLITIVIVVEETIMAQSQFPSYQDHMMIVGYSRLKKNLLLGIQNFLTVLETSQSLCSSCYKGCSFINFSHRS